MKKVIFLIISIYSTLIFAQELPLDLTFDLQLKNYMGQGQETDTNIDGKIIFNRGGDKYSLDGEYYFGDSGEQLYYARVKFFIDKSDLEIGRNRIGWGTGYNFNPTDIFNKEVIGSKYDPTYSKRGIDSIVCTRYFGNFTSMQLIYGYGNEEIQDEYGIRFRTNINDYDFDVIYAEKRASKKEYEKKIVGGDFAGSIPKLDFGVWGEFSYYIEEEKWKYVSGIDRYFLEKFYINMEYMQNDFGIDDDFDQLDLEEYTGEVLGSDYVIVSVNYDYSFKWNFTYYTFLNINDKSSINGGKIQYNYNDNIEVYVMPFLMTGDKRSEFGSISNEYGELACVLNLRLIF